MVDWLSEPESRFHASMVINVFDLVELLAPIERERSPGPESFPRPCYHCRLLHAPINFAALDRPKQPVRIRLNATAHTVRHEGPPNHATAVSVDYVVKGRFHRVRARSVVRGTGPHGASSPTCRSSTARPTSSSSACSAWSPASHSPTGASSPSRDLEKPRSTRGNSFAIRRMPSYAVNNEPLSPDNPTVLTMKIYFTQLGLPLQQQGAMGRMKMLSTSFSKYEKTLRAQFQLMFGRWGFDARRDIASIILNRWGHAYLCTQPGFFFGTGGKPAPRDILRRAPSIASPSPTPTSQASWTTAPPSTRRNVPSPSCYSSLHRRKTRLRMNSKMFLKGGTAGTAPRAATSYPPAYPLLLPIGSQTSRAQKHEATARR